MINEILLRRKNKLLLQKGTQDKPNTAYIATILKNIDDLGYTFAQEVYEY